MAAPVAVLPEFTDKLHDNVKDGFDEYNTSASLRRRGLGGQFHSLSLQGYTQAGISSNNFTAVLFLFLFTVLKV